MTTNSLGYEVDQYSIAQSFFVNVENGIFVTKIQLFFKQTDESASITLPVDLEIRPMTNGYPVDSIVIPGSEVVVPASSVNFTTDASTPTDFIFEEPIYLNGLTDYAFVVATNTSKYELFAAQPDTFVLGSSEKRISKQQTNGSLFFSQNGATFSPAQDLDLSFKIRTAKFKHTSATVTLKNTTVPQKLLTNNPLSITNGSTKVTVNHPNHGFQVNDRFNISLGSGSVGNLDSDTLSGLHAIDSADYSGFTFTADTAATETAIGGGNNVLCDKNIKYNILYPTIQNLNPNATAIFGAFKGVQTLDVTDANYGDTSASNRYTKDTTFTNISLNSNNTASQAYSILSQTVNDSAGFSDGTGIISLALSSLDSNVSPVIDLQRVSLTGIGYQIDKQAQTDATDFNVPINYVEESNPTGGSAASKHITNAVTLTEDAVGLKIILAANRPPQADFQMWFRTATSDEVINDKQWILQPEETNNPSDTSVEIFRDYEYLPGGEGGNLTPFTQFQLKIVMRSTSSSNPPIFKSLRIIALSV